MNTQIIGNYIHDKRILRNWTQEEFAEKLNVSPKTVSTWENGNFTSIKNDNLDKLSEVLQVSIGEIYLGKDMNGLDENDKMLLDQALKTLNERVDGVHTITIKVEDRGLLSMEIGVYAFGFSVFAIALAFWAASSRTPLTSFACLILGLFGIVFAVFGKRVIAKLTKQIQRERDQSMKN